MNVRFDMAGGRGANLRAGAGPGLAAFRHRNYRLFFAGQLVSLVGTWMQSVAQAWLILTLTGDPFWLGVIAAAQFGPVLVFGLFGGVLADALPKRRTLVATQAAMMLLAFALWLLVATNVVQVWMIVVIAMLLGVANAIDMPVRQSFAVEMVGREDISNAVALNSAMFNGARIVGPAIAGLVIAATGVAIAFLVNALSFLAVIIGLLLMKDSELVPLSRVAPRPHSVHEVMEQLREGLTYVVRTPMVILAVAVVGGISTVAMNFNVTVPAYAKDVAHTGADGFGFLMAATGIGSLVAALWLAFARRRPQPRLLLGGGVLLGLAEIGLAATTSFPVALGLLFLVGVGGIVMAATANAMIQLRVPDDLRGRVLAVYTTVFAGSTPIGGLLTGWIASQAGVPVALLVGGGLAVAIALTAVLWLRARSPGRAEAASAHVDSTPAIASTSQRAR